MASGTPSRTTAASTVTRRIPLADQVEAVLAERLRSGYIQPGEQLPSEHHLAGELGVSRATVRIALNALTKRGLVIGRQGVGNFASHAARMDHDLTEAVDLNDLIARSGRTPGVVFDRAEVVTAPLDVSRALGLQPGVSDTVLRCHKRFTADGETVVLAISSLPARLLGRPRLDDLARRPADTEPLFAFLAGHGLGTSFQTSTVTACRGDEIAYPDHGLDPHEAVLEMVETGYTDGNEPCWHSHNWYAPDAMTFQLVRRPPTEAPTEAPT